MLLLIMGLGNNLENKFGSVLRIGSVVWAMIIGTVAAAAFDSRALALDKAGTHEDNGSMRPALTTFSRRRVVLS